MDRTIKERARWSQNSDGSTPKRLPAAGSVLAGEGCRERMEIILGPGTEDLQLQPNIDTARPRKAQGHMKLTAHLRTGYPHLTSELSREGSDLT